MSGDVEENEEEVECDKAEEPINLGETGLPLEIVQNFILRKLYTIQLADVMESRAHE